MNLSDMSKVRKPGDLYKMVDKIRRDNRRLTRDDFIGGLLKPNVMLDNRKTT